MSRTPSTVGLALLTVPAVALVAAGGLILFRPALVLETVPELEPVVASLEPETVVLALVLLLVAFAPTVGIASRLRPSATSALVDDGSSDRSWTPVDPRDSSARSTVVGASIDEQISLATAYEDEPRDVREAARESLCETLRPVAATAYANRAGVADDDARAAVEAGVWTDDPRARAFLAGPDGPSTPLWCWLVDLLTTSDPFGRHLEATLDEIDRLQSAATIERPETTTDATAARSSADSGDDSSADDRTAASAAEVSA
ncbi:DUF7269 family protein [Natronolimnohabitans innermongolicus]|uniref:Uncharacterized protein n=1 Tax=Natronolimnohabitans innermongolicus JCM 12255 TaxID=1227499 RepID=L9WY14_9EURY|nr:hypothetical protein [Natronolimnohabitans innermongolicus]ELY53253.1 hypothetical protein C493_14523 [Natronolimnohabitans innermongolicus JCM 12255]